MVKKGFVRVRGVLAFVLVVLGVSVLVPLVSGVQGIPHAVWWGFAENTTFESGRVIDTGLVMNVSGPFSGDMAVFAEIDNVKKSLSVLEVLQEEGIDFEVNGATYDISNSSTSKDLVYTGAGRNLVHLVVSGNQDKAVSFEMNLAGFPVSGVYPKRPQIDVDKDGFPEWQFLGSFMNYSGFVLPSGLDESKSGSSVKMSGDKKYYCEVVNLPFARDYEVHAKVADANTSNQGALNATILTFSSGGSSVKAYGNALYDCALSLGENDTQLDYESCEMHLNLSLSGNSMVCVYNRVSVESPDYYVLARDNQGSSAYVCTPSSVAGEFDCTSSSGGDFFMKVKGGQYDEELKGMMSFQQGVTSNMNVVLAKLNQLIAQCKPVTSGCALPLEVTTTSKGVVRVQDLSFEYVESGVTKVETNVFYDLTSFGGLITDVYSTPLVDGDLVTIPVSALALRAPNVTQEVEYTLEGGIVGGPSEDEIVKIVPISYGGNASVQQLLVSVAGYKDVFGKMVSLYGGVLEVLGEKDKISQAVSDLSVLQNKLIALNVTNGTNQSVVDETSAKLSKILSGKPLVITVLDEMSEESVVTPEDVLLEMVSGEEERMKVYYAQNKVSAQSRVQYFSVEYLNGSERSGTVVERVISSPYSSGSVFEVIPSSMVSSVNSVNFGLLMESVVKPSSPGLVRLDFSSLGSVTYAYMIEGKNVVLGASESRVVVVPDIIPEADSRPLVMPVCGNGVCESVDVDGEIIALEDARSCPQDCKRKVPFLRILFTFVIGGLVVGAVWVYTKYHTPGEGWRFSFGKKTSERKPVFGSRADEESLTAYVDKVVKKGMGKKDVEGVLLKQGWKKDQIDVVFEKLGKK